MRSNQNLEVLVYVEPSFLFPYLFLFLPPYLLISLFTYFFLSLFFISSLFLRVLLFTFFSIFLEPEPKLFHVTWVKQITLTFYFFTWSVMENQKNIVKFGVPGFFGCSGVPGCSGVFQSVSVLMCSGVSGFSTCHSFNHF